jgi:hypothetical protein
MVDLDNDDDDMFSDTTSERGGSFSFASSVPITDPFVLDLFVVFGKPFALDGSFWTTGALVAMLQGGVMGFVCLAFFNAFEWISKSWLGDFEDSNDGNTDYYQGMENGQAPAILGTGKWWWIAVTTSAGMIIGIIKLIPIVHFPKQPKGLFSEVKGEQPNGMLLLARLPAYIYVCVYFKCSVLIVLHLFALIIQIS